MTVDPGQGPILFFDGVCNLCNRFIDFAIRRPRLSHVKFAPLQGETAQIIVFSRSTQVADSIFLFEDGRLFQESDAVLAVLPQIGGLWSLFAVLRLIPRPVRDGVYRWVARNRYRIFGKRQSCRVPSEEERARFLP